MIFLTVGGHSAEADALLAEQTRAGVDPSRMDDSAAATFQYFRAVRSLLSGDPSTCLANFQGRPRGDRSHRRSAQRLRDPINMGFILGELGDFEGAEGHLRAAMATADRMGLHDLAATALHNLGLVLAYRGQLEEARRIEQRAVAAFAEQGDPRALCLARTYLARILILSDDLTAAEREARAAEQVLLAVAPARAGALAVLARAELGQGRGDQALVTAREAWGLLESLGTIEEGEALIRLVYAEALAASGNEREYGVAIAAARDHLVARAARISDPGWRERFLSAVPDNARTLALAAAATEARARATEAPSA